MTVMLIIIAASCATRQAVLISSIVVSFALPMVSKAAIVF